MYRYPTVFPAHAGMRRAVEQAENVKYIPDIMYDTIALEMSLRSMLKDHG